MPSPEEQPPLERPSTASLVVGLIALIAFIVVPVLIMALGPDGPGVIPPR